MKYDIISVGDATIDTFLFINDAQVACALDRGACQLCVNYADKLPVEKMVRTVAGNATNAAVGSARLGLKTAFVCTVGNDGAGELIREAALKEGVDTRFIKINAHAETNASTVLSFKGERTIFVYHAKRAYSLPEKLPAARAMYYTSVGARHANLNKQVIRYVTKHKVRLAYNPGTFQMKAGLAAMKPLLRVVDSLFVNKEEAARILGYTADTLSIAKELSLLGPRIVVITDGPNGSFCYEGATGHSFSMGIPKTPVVERTGAGDAFATAFFAARCAGKTMQEAMCDGTMNSSSVIMKIGPHAGLLSQQGLKKFHKKYAHQCAK